MENGQDKQAWMKFEYALGMASTASELAEAYQLRGIAERKLGLHLDAMRSLERARDEATRSQNWELLCRVLRDLAEAYHDYAMSLHGKRRRRFLELALETFALAYPGMSPIEHYVTVGFEGLTLYHIGKKAEGRECLQTAHEGLVSEDKRNVVYELNNLIRLLRVSHLVKRLWSAKAALAMTGKDTPGRARRMDVRMALLGDRPYRYAKSAVQWYRRMRA